MDTYALAHVLQKSPKSKAMYTKIIHKQLNTMVVNNRWKMGQATYCLCGKCNETWLHVLQCSAPAPTAHRELCLSDFELKLKRTKTYPPLADFLYDIMETIAQSPDEPVIANAKYHLESHRAYQRQSSIGWGIFFRGFI